MMRVDPIRSLLLVECSGRISTDEALRAIEHACALAEAGSLRAVECDLTNVRRGPASTAVIGQAILTASQRNIRAAIIAGQAQLALAARVASLGSLSGNVRVFADRESAREWLALESVSPPHIGETERRHLAPLTAEAPRATAMAPALRRGIA